MNVEVLFFLVGSIAGAVGGLIVLIGRNIVVENELQRKRNQLDQKLERLEEREQESMLKALRSVHSNLKLKQEEITEAQSGLVAAPDILEEGAIQTRYGPTGPIEEQA